MTSHMRVIQAIYQNEKKMKVAHSGVEDECGRFNPICYMATWLECFAAVVRGVITIIHGLSYLAEPSKNQPQT